MPCLPGAPRKTKRKTFHRGEQWLSLFLFSVSGQGGSEGLLSFDHSEQENAELKRFSGHPFPLLYASLQSGNGDRRNWIVDDQELRALRLEEEQLERLRLLVEPEYWPRIYAMLKRVRDEIKKEENSRSAGEAA